MYTQNKARFSHLLRHLAWKRRGPILVSALHWSLAYLDTYHLVTAPGPTRGTYTRKEPLEGTGFLQAGCPSCNQPTMPIHCRKPEALTQSTTGLQMEEALVPLCQLSNAIQHSEKQLSVVWFTHTHTYPCDAHVQSRRCHLQYS